MFLRWLNFCVEVVVIANCWCPVTLLFLMRLRFQSFYSHQSVTWIIGSTFHVADARAICKNTFEGKVTSNSVWHHRKGSGPGTPRS